MEINNSLFKNITQDKENTENKQTITLNKQEVALNTLIELVILSHKRGSLTLEESSKAWESIKIFMPDVEKK